MSLQEADAVEAVWVVEVVQAVEAVWAAEAVGLVEHLLPSVALGCLPLGRLAGVLALLVLKCKCLCKWLHGWNRRSKCRVSCRLCLLHTPEAIAHKVGIRY